VGGWQATAIPTATEICSAKEAYDRHCARTSLWVYAIFLILTYYRVIACFKGQVSKNSLQITPVIVTLRHWGLALSTV